MAYDFTTPAELPLPADAVAGSTQTQRLLERLGRACNAQHAIQTCQPIGQSWPAGQCTYASPIVRTVATWRVPLLSDDHTALFFDIHATNVAGVGGTVRFVSGIANVQWAVNGAVGVSTRYTGTLIMPQGATWDDVSLVMFATGVGDEVRLDRVNAEFTVLTSPLGAGRVPLATGGDFNPMGSTVVATDHALSSFIGQASRDNLEGLQARPRQVLSWSGIDLPGAAAGIDHGPHAHRSSIITRPGTFQAGVVYTLWVRVQAHPANQTRVTVGTATRARDWPQLVNAGSQVAEITVAAGLGNVWLSSSFTMPELRGIDGLDHPGCIVGFTADPENPGVETTASLYAISAWGE